MPRHGSGPATPQAPPPAQAHPVAVLVAIGAGAATTVGLWWANTPSISGFGDWLTNAGRITGLLAGYSVVVLLALMARVPALERGIGSDRLARWHSMGARYTISLVVTHALLIVWGYSVTAHTNVIHQEWTLLRSYPDVLMATVAGLLLVGVGVSSARAARRRMRYETWYYLHFYTYLAVALAFSHQFATGAEFISNAPARFVWAALYLSVAALLLHQRGLHAVAAERARPDQELKVDQPATGSPGPRTVHVEHCMGTVFSFDVRDAGDWSRAITEAVAWLHQVDETFSTYRADSVVSRLGRGELMREDTPAEVQAVLALCDGVTEASGGYFSTRPAGPDGAFDPSGLVKGWAIERASELLREHGSHHHSVNGGGDIQLAGERAPGQPWRVGISHPARPGMLLTVVSARDGAVATSGTAERGFHVTNPLTGGAATELVSVTVVGRHLTAVDAYATAALAMGRRSQGWLEHLDGSEAVALDASGASWQTSGMGGWTRPRADAR